MSSMTRPLTALLLATLIACSAHAQYFWAEDGIPIRQGLHLGWNGAMQPLGEDVAMFYNDCRRDGTRDVWAEKLTAEGDRLWGEQGLLVTPHESEQRSPVSALYPDGTMLLVWEDYVAGRYRDLYAQRYTADGLPLWTPSTGVAIVEADHDQFDPHIAIAENGTTFIVFTDDRESGGGENTRLGAYAQVVGPNGNRIGPADGFVLVDRYRGWNISAGIVAVDGNGYALVSMATTAQEDIVIQKILPDGSIAWPEDPAIVTTECGPPPIIAVIPGGLAIGYTSCDFPQEDAYVKCVDLELNDLPGWSENGLLLAVGNPHAATVGLVPVNGSVLKVAAVNYDLDVNQSIASVGAVSFAGELLGAVGMTNVAAGVSPIDLVNAGGDTLLIAWVERTEVDNIRTHRLRLAKSWSPTTLSELLPPDVFVRVNKELRTDLVKPLTGAARLALLTGRSVERPESLWTVALASDGEFAQSPELLGSGITYDVFDKQVVRIDDEHFAILWSDTRERIERDLYLQIVDRFGQPLLEPNGKLIARSNGSLMESLALAADHHGGVYVAWRGYLSSGVYFANVMRIDDLGNEVWPDPVILTSPIGFYGNSYLVSDDAGVYFARTEYNSNYITRSRVTRITSSGQIAWTPETRELTGPMSSDMSLESVATDGASGLFLTMTVGPWEDTDIRLYHLAADGTAGTGWSDEGLEFSSDGVRDAFPQVCFVGSGVVLTYGREVDGASMYSLRATAYSASGSALWGPLPRNLLGEEPRIFGYAIESDGLGGFFVGWDDYRSTQYARIYCTRFDANGNALWNQAGVRISTDDNEQGGLSMTADGSGGLWAVWEDQRNNDDYPEFDLYATHLDAAGNPANIAGFVWPAEGFPLCDVPTHSREVKLISWIVGSAVAVWMDQRSSNPGRCCGAGSVGDIFNNIYAQTLSEVSLSAGQGGPPATISDLSISSIYPNPFNPAATIEFTLPRMSRVKLSILNTLGQQVTILADQTMNAGTHKLSFDGSKLSSGVYFARVEDGRSFHLRKMVLLK